jgi:hypothetical protein
MKETREHGLQSSKFEYRFQVKVLEEALTYGVDML